MYGANLSRYRQPAIAARQEFPRRIDVREFIELLPLFASVLLASIALQLGAWVTFAVVAGLFCVIVLAAKI